jgi:hypothetical protein
VVRLLAVAMAVRLLLVAMAVRLLLVAPPPRWRCLWR